MQQKEQKKERAPYKWSDRFDYEALTTHSVVKKPRPNILSCGLGVDSTSMLLFLTNPEKAKEWLRARGRDPSLVDQYTRIDAVFFADPGSEHQSSYDLLHQYIVPYCEARGIPLYRIRSWSPSFGFRTLREEKLASGTIPFLPQAKHTCSVKYKIEPQKWAADYLFGGVITKGNSRLKDRLRRRMGMAAMLPGYAATFYIGFNAGEEGRKTKAGSYAIKDVSDPYHQSAFPNLVMEITREEEVEIIKEFAPHWPPIFKSSCFYCPYMTMAEITHTIVNCPDEWEQVKEMEDRFREVSPEAFADGRWSKDSWAEGARLFWPQSRVARKPITTHEIEQLVIKKAKQLVSKTKV